MNNYLFEEIKIFLQKIKNISFPDLEEIKDFTDNANLEILIKSFFFGISSLRNDMENNIPLILSQIYNKLFENKISNTPKTFIEISPDKYYSQSIEIKKNTKFITNNKIYFSSLEEIKILPLFIKNKEIIKYNQMPEILKNEIKTSSILKIVISSYSTPIRKLNFEKLRLFFYGCDGLILLKDLFLKNNFINAYTCDSEDNLQDINLFNKCKLKFNEIFSSGWEILENFHQKSEMFQISILYNFNLENIFNDLVIYIPLESSQDYSFQIALWWIYVENSLEIKTNPFKINKEDLQIPIDVFDKNLIIYKVKNLLILKNNSYIELEEKKYNWCSFIKNKNFYISFLDKSIDEFIGNNAYCNVYVNNGNSINNLNLKEEVFLEEKPFLKCNFLFLPTYKEKSIDIINFLKYINTDYKFLLENKNVFLEVINNLLEIYNNGYGINIYDVNINPTIFHKKWGKYTVPIKGYNVEIFLKTNLVNPFIFIKILGKFISTFSTLDTFINLFTEWKNEIYSFQELLYEEE